MNSSRCLNVETGSHCCPHCQAHFAGKVETNLLGNEPPVGEPYSTYTTVTAQCLACRRLITCLEIKRREVGKAGNSELVPVAWGMILPERGHYPPCPPEVPTHVRRDYEEASLVLDLSPNSAAMLIRRALGTVLREEAGASQKLLGKQVPEVLNSGELSTSLATSLEAIRNLGNLGAHLKRDIATDEVIDVTKSEAEWLIELLGALLDHYYVRPAQEKRQIERLNQKLEAAGKPSLATANSPPEQQDTD